MAKKETTITSVTTRIPSALRILRKAIQLQQPVFLWGPPGIGKSDIVYQVADEQFAQAYASTHQLIENPSGGRHICLNKETGLPCRRPWLIDIRALLHEPVDFTGIPQVDADGVTRFHPTNLLPLAGMADPRGGVVFLDELSNADPQVSNALLGWVLDGEISGYMRCPGWVDVAAGNRITDGTFSKKLSKALGSRFATHLELMPDLDSFCAWGLANKMKAQLIAFLRLRPELLHDFDPTAEGSSFPCPRTWARADAWIGETSREDELPFFSGLLGKGAAVEMITFLRDYEDMIDPDECIRNPKKAPLPTKPSQMFAMSGSMSRKLEKANADKVLTYMERMPLEFQTLFVKDAMAVNPQVSLLPEVMGWIKTNHKMLLPGD